MATRFFAGGPWNNTSSEDYQEVPAQEIPVYADPPADMVCADEQVTLLRGHYVRSQKLWWCTPTRTGFLWWYLWRPKESSLMSLPNWCYSCGSCLFLLGTLVNAWRAR